MAIDARYFTTRRCRTLYYLLPLANGIVIEAGHYLLRRMSGGPLLDFGVPDSVANFLVGAAYLSAALILPGLIICTLEISMLSWSSRRNLVASALGRLLSRQDGEATNMAFVGPGFLTFVGGMAVVLVLRSFSMWIPDDGGISSFGIILFTVFAYGMTVVPSLVDSEQATTDRSNNNASGGIA